MVEINNSNNSVKKCINVLKDTQLMPMMSIKNIVAGSYATVLPWLILLFIVSVIIII